LHTRILNFLENYSYKSTKEEKRGGEKIKKERKRGA
jgi:hypothetical protein